MRRTMVMVCVLIGILFSMTFMSCVTRTGYWIPGTDFDTTITPEQYLELPTEEQKKHVEIEYRMFDPAAITKVEQGAVTAEGVFEVVRPMVPEPLATGGSLILGAITSLLVYASRKKVVTKLIETAQGIQNYKDGKATSLSTALEATQGDATKKTIARMKADGAIVVTKESVEEEEEVTDKTI